MVSLDIGPNATRFFVHDSVLCKSEVFATKSDPWGLAKQSVALPELDNATAHSLVHYLYTGRYQTLSTQTSSDKVIPEGYKLGACVYCAAVRYKLPGLAELAKEKILSFDDDVSIFDVLAVARDHAFPLLPEEDAWYPTYIEGALTSAMAEDPGPFRKPEFITQVEGNSKLLQVVWKTVMSNYSRAPVTPVSKEDEAVTLTVETVPEVAECTELEEPKSAMVLENATDEPEAVDDPALELANPQGKIANALTEDIAAGSETTQEDSTCFEEIEPTVETPATPEPFTDELGFGMSKTYQQMGKKPDQIAAKDHASEKPKTPVHVRSDSVTQVEQVVEELELDTVTSVDAEPTGDAENVPNEASDVATPPKKSKKGKKKKSSIVFH
jgi:hypothetical protein